MTSSNISNASYNRISSRESNIELARITAMTFIIFSHLSGHGGVFNTNNTANLLWGGVLLPGGKIGYDCFAIITAWFCIDKDFKGSRLVKIALEVVFYNFLGMTLAALLNNEIAQPIGMRNFLGCLFPVFGNSHGFAVYYMIFLMILPLLNAVSRKMTERNIQAMIALMFMMQIGARIFSVIIDYSSFVDLGNGLFTFIILYFSVAYIKRQPIKIVAKKSILFFIFIAIWMLSAFANILAAVYPDVRIFSLSLSVINSDSSPLNMIAGFCMFFFFKGLSVKHSSMMNFIASHTFGILLLHDHNYFRYVIWKRVFFVENVYDTNFLILVVYTVLVVLAIFTVGIIVDSIREYILERPIQKTKIYAKVCCGLESYFKLQPIKGDACDKRDFTS